MSTVKVTLTVEIEGPTTSVQPQSYMLGDSVDTGDNPRFFVRTVRETVGKLEKSMSFVVASMNGDIDEIVGKS